MPASARPLLLLPLLLAGCAGPSRTAPTASPSADEAAVLALDRLWMVHASHQHDAAAYERATAPEFVLTFSNGNRYTREHELTSLRAPGTEPPEQVYAVDEQAARVYGEAAVTMGRFYIARNDTVLTQSRYTNTYVRREGVWRAVASQFTRAQD